MSQGSYVDVRYRSNQGFVFQLRSKTSVILGTGGPYDSEQAALDAVATLQRHCAYDTCYKREALDDGRWTFVIESPEGARLATGPVFSSREMMEATIKLAQLSGPQARPMVYGPGDVPGLRGARRFRPMAA